jgi:hypothetical protein
MLVASCQDLVLRDATLSSRKCHSRTAVSIYVQQRSLVITDCQVADTVPPPYGDDDGCGGRICFFDIRPFKYQFYNMPALCQISATIDASNLTKFWFEGRMSLRSASDW